MKDRLQIMKMAADKLKSDKRFWSYYILESDRKMLKCSKEDFYKLCLCKIPATDEGLKKVSEYCKINYEKLKEKWKKKN